MIQRLSKAYDDVENYPNKFTAPARHLTAVDVFLPGELVQSVKPVHALANDLVFLVTVRNEVEACTVPDVRGAALLKVEVALLFRTEFALGRHLAEVGHEAGFILKGQLVGVHRAGVEVHHVRGRFRMGGVKVRPHLHQSKPPFSTPQ